MITMELSIRARGYIRKGVTEIFNSKSGFAELSLVQRQLLVSKLNDHSAKLLEYDTKIQTYKLSQPKGDAMSQQEYESAIDSQLETEFS